MTEYFQCLQRNTVCSLEFVDCSPLVNCLRPFEQGLRICRATDVAMQIKAYVPQYVFTTLANKRTTLRASKYS